VPALSNDRILELITPYAPESTLELAAKLSAYLDLLLKWNARTNLTAIREPEEIVRRHFGESLFCGQILAKRLAIDAKLMDFGSGAGFPGLPMQLQNPGWKVTLAESQNKKAAFLLEANRTLAAGAEIWAKRVEDMPATRLFDCVAMRAVDKMDLAIAEAQKRLAPGGLLALLAVEDQITPDFEVHALPGGEKRFLLLRRLTSA